MTTLQLKRQNNIGSYSKGSICVRHLATLLLSIVILVFPVYAGAVVSSHFVDISVPITNKILNNSDSVRSKDSIEQMVDTSCGCHPSLPLEIAASSIISGVPAYWGYRAFFDDRSGFRPETGLIPLSWLLYMVSLAPVAAWTSHCDASPWHTLWIGFGSQIVCSLLYEAAYGHNHVLNLYKINWPEYFALGVAPTVIASLVYNQFLHCRPKSAQGSDQGMYLMPSVNVDKSAALNFGMRF
ncbi:MAG: hypothetical protein ACHQNE_00710 [Candidatus Kapaibacterium sp.]